MIEIYLFSLIILILSIFFGLKKINQKAYVLINKIQSQAENGQHHYDQIDSLLWLYHTVKPDYPFPRFRGWAASPDFLRIIVEKILAQNPKQILELGSGSSTIVLAEFLKKTKKSIKLISVDERKESYLNTFAQLKNRKLNKKVSLLFCPLTQYRTRFKNYKWYSIPEKVLKKKFDLVIIDGPSTLNDPLSRQFTLDRLRRAAASNCTFIMDDAGRPGEQEILQKWVATNKIKNLELVSSEKGTASFYLN